MTTTSISTPAVSRLPQAAALTIAVLVAGVVGLLAGRALAPTAAPTTTSGTSAVSVPRGADQSAAHTFGPRGDADLSAGAGLSVAAAVLAAPSSSYAVHGSTWLSQVPAKASAIPSLRKDTVVRGLPYGGRGYGGTGSTAHPSSGDTYVGSPYAKGGSTYRSQVP